MKHFSFLLLLLLPVAAFAQHYGSDTVHLYFPFNQRTLPPGVKQQLDEMAYDGYIGLGTHATIIGYADYVGSSTYNDKLSADRANAAAVYLLQYGLTKNNIIILKGAGEVARTGMSGRTGNQPDRRVDLVLNARAPVAEIPLQTSARPVAQPKKIDKITTLKPNETLVLENLYFYPGRHTLVPESMPVLTDLYQIMRAHSTLRLKIEGHICCIKNYPDAEDLDSGDGQLSVNRARYIRNWLVHQGISASRLEYEGFGRKRPVVENEITEADANRNRRVELRVLSQ